jgi:hypothetical protein
MDPNVRKAFDELFKRLYESDTKWEKQYADSDAKWEQQLTGSERARATRSEEEDCTCLELDTALNERISSREAFCSAQ